MRGRRRCDAILPGRREAVFVVNAAVDEAFAVRGGDGSFENL